MDFVIPAIIGIGVIVALLITVKKVQAPALKADGSLPGTPPGTDGLDSIVRSEADKFGLRPSLVFAVIEKESSFKPDIVGSFGEIGLMQITKGALTDYNSANSPKISSGDLFEPATNVHVGCWYLNDMKNLLFRGGRAPSDDLILQAYNGGIGNVLNNKTSPEARAYAVKVLGLEVKYA